MKALSNLFPLLRRDLGVISLHKRTYILRIFYGAVFYTIFFVLWADYTDQRHGQILGNGKILFPKVYLCQYISIFILLPAMMAGAIAKEREAHNLPMLLISKLRSWEIIIEKYISHLLPMATFILMTIPAIGLCFALGGVTLKEIFTELTLVSLWLLAIAAIPLMCSCAFNTTAKAIIASYLAVGSYWFCIYEIWNRRNFINICAVNIFAIVLSLFVAKSLLLKTLSNKDKKIKTPKKEFLFCPNLLPSFIAWREVLVQRCSRFNKVIVFCSLLAILSFDKSTYVWAFLIATMIIASKSVVLISKEKRQQTLELLLITPISSKELLKQKTKGIDYLIFFFLAVFFIFILFINISLPSGYWYYLEDMPALYTVKEIPNKWGPWIHIAVFPIAIFLCFHMTKWISLWIGLKVKSIEKGLLIAIAVFLVWFFLAPFFMLAMFFWEWNYRSEVPAFTLFSPVFMVVSVFDGFPGCSKNHLVLPALAHFIWYGWLCFLVKKYVLCYASHYLGRNE